MYYYIVSTGDHHVYYSKTIGHTEKFTNKEFTHLFNQCVRTKNDDYSADVVAEKLCSEYGFVLIEPIFEINTYHGFDGDIDIDKIDNEKDYYSEEWRLKR